MPTPCHSLLQRSKGPTEMTGDRHKAVSTEVGCPQSPRQNFRREATIIYIVYIDSELDTVVSVPTSDTWCGGHTSLCQCATDIQTPDHILHELPQLRGRQTTDMASRSRPRRPACEDHCTNMSGLQHVWPPRPWELEIWPCRTQKKKKALWFHINLKHSQRGLWAANRIRCPCSSGTLGNSIWKHLSRTRSHLLVQFWYH
jgi:hypothetical protein